MRSEKELEEELPNGIGMGVPGWVLNILVSFFVVVVVFFFFFGCAARWVGP